MALLDTLPDVELPIYIKSLQKKTLLPKIPYKFPRIVQVLDFLHSNSSSSYHKPIPILFLKESKKQLGFWKKTHLNFNNC